MPHLRKPACICTVVLLTMAIFFLFFWNPLSVYVINYKIADVTPHVHVSAIKGPFPLVFDVPMLDIADGKAQVHGVHVQYVGTYNPLEIATQLGTIVRADATCTLAVFGYAAEVPLNNMTLTRAEGGVWTASLDTSFAGNDATVSVDVYADGTAPPRITAQIGDNIHFTATGDELRLIYAGARELLVLSTDGDAFSLALAGVAHLAGTWDVGGADGKTASVRDVTNSFFDHAPHTMLDSLSVGWAGGKVRVDVSDWLSLVWSTDGTLDGSVRTGTAGADRSRITRAAGGGPDQAVAISPPFPTPFGGLATIHDMHTDEVTGTRSLVLDIGAEKLSLATDGVFSYGPIFFTIDTEAAMVEVKGGFFEDFTCVRLRGRVVYDNPSTVLIEHVSAVKGTDGNFRGHGSYSIPDKELKLSFDVTINT